MGLATHARHHADAAPGTASRPAGQYPRPLRPPTPPRPYRHQPIHRPCGPWPSGHPNPCPPPANNATRARPATAQRTDGSSAEPELQDQSRARHQRDREEDRHRHQAADLPQQRPNSARTRRTVPARGSAGHAAAPSPQPTPLTAPPDPRPRRPVATRTVQDHARSGRARHTSTASCATRRISEDRTDQPTGTRARSPRHRHHTHQPIPSQPELAHLFDRATLRRAPDGSKRLFDASSASNNKPSIRLRHFSTTPSMRQCRTGPPRDPATRSNRRLILWRSLSRVAL